MKTYSFKVVLERDEDFDGNPSGWHAYCPALERQGASTWGATERQALQNLNEVVRMVVESMLEGGEHLPLEPARSEPTTTKH
jgi:predicted RNase H-like HicB family nuclease